MILSKSIIDLQPNEKRLVKIFKELDTEVFSQNTISGAQFEDIFECKLANAGYVVLDIKVNKEVKKLVLSSDHPIQNVQKYEGYLREPFGSQSPPDFLIYENDFVLPIEIKSSKKTNIPMWNNSFPKQYAIYIFMAYADIPSKREIVYFKGSDVITPEATQIFKDRLSDAQLSSKFTKQELADLDVYNHGWNVYVRANVQQSLHTKQTVSSFIDHPNKNLNKKRVIEYLESLYQQTVPQTATF